MNFITNIVRKIKPLRRIASELYGLLENFIVKYPNTRLGMFLRKKYWGSKLKLGINIKICQNAILHTTSNELIEIGDNVELGPGVVINAGPCKGIFVGSNVSIAKGTFIRSANHRFDDINLPIQSQGHDCKTISFNNREYSIVIEDDCWISAHCILLSGAHIGKGSVIGAGSIVSKTIPPYSVAVGNPAKIIRNRFDA